MKFNISIAEIAKYLKVEVLGNINQNIVGINNITNALPGEATFFRDKKYLEAFKSSKASLIFVSNECNIDESQANSFIKCANPYIEFVKLLQFIESLNQKPIPGAHPSSVISNSAVISKSCNIGPNCTIEDHTIIEDDVEIMANVFVGKNVTIGQATRVFPNSTILDNTIIGKNCKIHPGSVIGSEGFGYIESNGGYINIPQLGNVIIEDNVDIGANTTIDRAMVGSTIIRMGTKIDNLVQIAHSVEVGENTGIAAQTGISGSSKIGKRNRLAGQVGIAGHLSLADDVTLYAQSGVASTIDEPGIYFGSPARKRLEAFRIEAVHHNLPKLAKEINEIKKILDLK